MPRSFLIKTKQQQLQRHDVSSVTDLCSNDVIARDDVRTSGLQHASKFSHEMQQPLGETGHIGSERVCSSSVAVTQQASIDKKIIDSQSAQMAYCKSTLESAAVTPSQLTGLVTSPPQSALFHLYPDSAVAWLRQLYAMCACADRPFPFPPHATAALPPPHCLMTSPEPVYYVTKMAPMQPFDPRWASCPSPSTAPSVEPVAAAARPGAAGACRTGGRRHRDFSIPSILSGSAGSSTGTDSDATTESDERCQSASSSVDDTCSAEHRRQYVTSCDHVTRAPVDVIDRRQLNKQQQFECPQCNKMYSTMGALKMHVRTHTLPCRCPLCGKAFSRPWLLQGHLRTHTGERPFQCPHCDRAFADRSNLRAHLQTHGGVKRYRCDRCQKPFSRMSLLTKHLDSSACIVTD